jgi:hypothetical protein
MSFLANVPRGTVHITLTEFHKRKSSLNHTKLNDNNEYTYISAKSVSELEE